MRLKKDEFKEGLLWDFWGRLLSASGRRHLGERGGEGAGVTKWPPASLKREEKKKKGEEKPTRQRELNEVDREGDAFNVTRRFSATEGIWYGAYRESSGQENEGEREGEARAKTRDTDQYREQKMRRVQ